MSFPDKLPFTAWAVALAAAFQAAESSTSFKAACVWCLVILAAAVETILLFLRSVAWKKSQKWIAGLFAMVPVSLLVVWGVAVPAYRKEFLTENLRVNFSLPHPSQLGTDRVDLNYSVSNKGLEPIFIEEISAIEIATTDFSMNPYRNGELCKLQGLYAPRGMMETWPHPGRKVLHMSMDRPALPTAPVAYGLQGPPPFPDDKKLDVAIYNPTTLSDGGKDVPRVPISIEAGKAASFAASFDTDPATWDTHNVMIVCGAIKFLRNDGVETWAICHPWIVARMYKDEKPAGDSTGPGITNYVGGSEERECDVRDHWPA